ncbi:hypothetical protein D9756_002489 [Leucocoprinus leucothites]|uniref:Large ribosomal subunit protein uL23m n=1 Tax=Leucocoprinus leucothites TaxID=201217 RepID=A0A8H5GC07_9AGAR|nr:hypothetical protein D9756_002489 [Leucoagaricus leucothites]
MQSLCRTFGSIRLYSKQARVENLHPEGALVARTLSTPLAVRRRREKKFLFAAPPPGETDARHGLTPTDKNAYWRRRKAGHLGAGRSAPLSMTKWVEQRNARRSRLRGVRLAANKQGQKETQVIGQPIYLPNITFRLVRNYTPPGEPYNPYEATFRVPHSVTKTDIRSYLLAVYGVKTTYIRTDNYFAPEPNNPRDEKKSYKSYKRAVVGLVDPFYYPHRVEDMAEKERAEYDEWLETNFQIKQHRIARKVELLRLTKDVSLKAPYATKRSHILRLVAERKQKREGLVSQIADEWKDMREKGEEIAWGENPLQRSSTEDAVKETSS